MDSIYFSPIYWIVPQIVKARPPLSRRRDKPKSAKRRCPRTDHFLYIIMSTWHKTLKTDFIYWCSYNWLNWSKCSHHNLFSLGYLNRYTGCSLSVLTDLLTDSCVHSGCPSVLVLHNRAMLLSAGKTFLLTIVRQKNILHLQKNYEADGIRHNLNSPLNWLL